jgi:ParB-like chromosome segregation protein Spo0J
MAKKKVEQENLGPDLQTAMWDITHLKEYGRNPRKNDEVVDRMVASIQEFGFRIPVIIKSDGTIVDGHLRYKAAKKMGMRRIPVALADELTDAQVKAFRLLANRSANWASWDDDLLKLEFEELKDMDFSLDLTGFDIDEILKVAKAEESEEKQTDLDSYTKKIQSPVYEIKGEKPTIQQLFDIQKTSELIKQIENSSITPEEKTFLKFAAYRHIVFSYENIAEYYAHSSPETQELMEKSALVIIDFKKAIENGFVVLSEEIAEAYTHDSDE